MINIIVTSKPVDGLLYYSYEYCNYLNCHGVECQVVIICHRKFTKEDYISSIKHKYVHCKNLVFDTFSPSEYDISLIMGRSMISLAFQDFNSYNSLQQDSLKKVFSKKLISVYSENHPTIYPLAIQFFSPSKVFDLCDTEVYPLGVGLHFEKRVDFSIHQTHRQTAKFEYLFLGTNDKYYRSAEKVISNYPDHGILTYKESYINPCNNNVFVPVENLMSTFNTYVYVKETFDPAPRIIQECKYFKKNIIYLRDNSLVDGGSVYRKRPLKEIDITPVLEAIEELTHDKYIKN
jgi:hypothetical protein